MSKKTKILFTEIEDGEVKASETFEADECLILADNDERELQYIHASGEKLAIMMAHSEPVMKSAEIALKARKVAKELASAFSKKDPSELMKALDRLKEAL